MKPLAALAALLIAVLGGVATASARGTYVIDNAHLLSPGAIARIDAKVGAFYAQTHKEVVVDTEPTVGAATAQAAAEQIFAQRQINGVLIYVAKSPKTIGVLPDAASARFFPPGAAASIRQAIADAFNAGDYSGGVVNGVNLVLSQYRSHLNALPRGAQAAPVGTTVQNATGGGFSMGWIWWLLALAVIFFIVRGIFRAMAGPRVYPPGYGGPGAPGSPGYGGPGYGAYGPGYGGGGFGGGGGFWSGLLGGLGGAWLGNEMFGNRGGGFMNDGGNVAGMGGGAAGGDASGWQNDPGQADLGNASFGGWGGGDGGGLGGGDAGGWGGGGFGGGDGGGGW